MELLNGSKSNLVGFEMKIALISDIHANYPALKAVENNYKKNKIQAIWMLGDAFGRGPHPEEIYHWMKLNFDHNNKSTNSFISKMPIIGSIFSMSDNNLWIVGNHDTHIFGWEMPEDVIIPYFIRIIDEDHSKKLSKFVDFQNLYNQEDNIVTISLILNGTQYILKHEFEKYGYIYPWDTYTIGKTVEMFKDKPLGTTVLFGHTHIPLLASVDSKGYIDSLKIQLCQEYFLDNDHFWFVNPGSVGSPSDLDPRATYAILDTQKRTIIFKKIAYKIDEVIKDVIKNNYPPLIKRQLETAPLPRQDIPEDWYGYYKNGQKQDCNHEET